MHWFSLTLLSQFTLIAYYFLSKKLLSLPNVDARVYGALLQIATGLIALPVALWLGFSFILSWQSAGLLVAMILIYVTAASLYYTCLQKIELSETTIIDSSGSVWTLLFGVLLLGESFSWQKCLGIALVLSGVGLLTITKRQKISLGLYEGLLLVAAGCYALGAIVDNTLLSFSTPTTYLSLTFLLSGFCMLALNSTRIKRERLGQAFSGRVLVFVGIGGLFTCLTYWLIYKAYVVGGEVSAMYPIQQLESVIVPLLAIVFLNERSRVGTKLVAGALAVSGLMFLK